jgi:pyoverdine/dityrosine biosynthesis protein Dit1
MAQDKQYNYLEFARMKDLLYIPMPDQLREITYVANCSNFRRSLLNKHGNSDLDIDSEIASNPDTMLTYLGYRRFLESDLKHIFPFHENWSSNGAYKRDVKYLAKELLLRGYVSQHHA